MGSETLKGNLAELTKLCGEMGVMDHFDDLKKIVEDEVHLRDSLVPFNANTRRNGKTQPPFVTQLWIREHIKRFDRGEPSNLGLFDNLE